MRITDKWVDFDLKPSGNTFSEAYTKIKRCPVIENIDPAIVSHSNLHENYVIHPHPSKKDETVFKWYVGQSSAVSSLSDPRSEALVSGILAENMVTHPVVRDLFAPLSRSISGPSCSTSRLDDLFVQTPDRLGWTYESDEFWCGATVANLIDFGIDLGVMGLCDLVVTLATLSTQTRLSSGGSYDFGYYDMVVSGTPYDLLSLRSKCASVENVGGLNDVERAIVSRIAQSVDAITANRNNHSLFSVEGYSKSVVPFPLPSAHLYVSACIHAGRSLDIAAIAEGAYCSMIVLDGPTSKHQWEMISTTTGTYKVSSNDVISAFMLSIGLDMIPGFTSHTINRNRHSFSSGSDMYAKMLLPMNITSYAWMFASLYARGWSGEDIYHVSQLALCTDIERYWYTTNYEDIVSSVPLHEGFRNLNPSLHGDFMNARSWFYYADCTMNFAKNTWWFVPLYLGQEDLLVKFVKDLGWLGGRMITRPVIETCDVCRKRAKRTERMERLSNESNMSLVIDNPGYDFKPIRGHSHHDLSRCPGMYGIVKRGDATASRSMTSIGVATSSSSQFEGGDIVGVREAMLALDPGDCTIDELLRAAAMLVRTSAYNAREWRREYMMSMVREDFTEVRQLFRLREWFLTIDKANPGATLGRSRPYITNWDLPITWAMQSA